MPWFKIKWNAGYGDSFEFIQCESKALADQEAYEHWREEAENQADYGSEGPMDDPTKDEDHPDYDPDSGEA